MNSHSVVNKRALEIPDVGIDETFLKKLEKQFSSLGGDKLENGKNFVYVYMCIYIYIYVYACRLCKLNTTVVLQ